MAEVEGVEPSSFGSEPKIRSAGLHLNTINGASKGVRTPVLSVVHLHSTIELYSHYLLLDCLNLEHVPSIVFILTSTGAQDTLTTGTPASV